MAAVKGLSIFVESDVKSNRLNQRKFHRIPTQAMYHFTATEKAKSLKRMMLLMIHFYLSHILDRLLMAFMDKFRLEILTLILKMLRLLK